MIIEENISLPFLCWPLIRSRLFHDVPLLLLNLFTSCFHLNCLTSPLFEAGSDRLLISCHGVETKINLAALHFMIVRSDLHTTS